MKILNNIQLEGSGSTDRNANTVTISNEVVRLFIYDDILYLQTSDNQIIRLHKL